MGTNHAESLLHAAQEDFRKGFTARGGVRLRQAAETGYAPAQLAYAKALFDTPTASAHRNAADLLHRAADQELPGARYARAAAHYSGLLGNASTKSALCDLNAAAEAGHAPAETALALAWEEHGSAEALAAAQAWLARAATHGSRVAELLMRASDGPLKEHAASSPAPTLQALAEHRNPASRVLHDSPKIAVGEAALSIATCAWLRITARDTLRVSRVLDPATGHPRPHPVRTGMTTYLPPSRLEFPAVRITDRLARCADASYSRAEPLAVLRYRRSEEYRPHRDALGPAALTGDTLRQAGDRSATVLVYLNNPAGGGETAFPHLQISVSPKIGRVLVFENLDSQGQPNPLSLHAGLPVSAGSKWLASLWLRQQPLSE